MPLRPLFVSLLFVACAACQHAPPVPAAESAEVHASAPEPAAETTAPTVTASPAVEAPASPGCSADADCLAVDHYCDSCRCIPLAASAPRPTCDGAAVQCFVAPCRGQHAVCRDGVCALSGSNEEM
ncbi:MAG TPA: hypothetical protein VJV78_17210 [Polyangiales bacterium]|nr:hypothetical protein [Polyangiales bacterium]